MQEAGIAMEDLAGAGEGNLQRKQPYPAGFRFQPTEEELVQHYLIPKMENRPLPFPIPTLDVYGTEPSRLPMDMTYSLDGEIYCFARRTRRTENGTRANRTVMAPAGEAMSGTWHASSKPQGISVGGRVVAVKRQLSFWRDGGGPRRNNSDGGWIMHEYCLEDSTKFQDLVLCMIRNRNAGKEEQQPAQLKSLSPRKRLRAAASTSPYADGNHALQQAPMDSTTAAFDAGGEGVPTAAPRASGSTVDPILADPAVPLPDNSGIGGLQVPEKTVCGATTAPVWSANTAVDPDDLRSMQLSRLQMLLHSVSPGPQAPPAPEHGNWSGSCPSASPVPAAPACGHRPNGPNTPVFFLPLQTLRSMPINTLPPETWPEQGMACWTDGCSHLRLNRWGLPFSSATRIEDLAGFRHYVVFNEAVQLVGEMRDDAGDGDASASESVDSSGGMEGGGTRGIRYQANHH